MDENQNEQIIIVSAVIKDLHGNLLLLKRKEDAKRAPGKWELPSGKVQFGEEPLSALKRIVIEQTSHDGVVGKLIASKSLVLEESNKQLIIFYNAVYLDKHAMNSFLITDDKHEKAEWHEMSKIQQNSLEKNLIQILPEIQSELLDKSKINHIVDKTTATEEINIFTDGGSRGNPGPSAAGFVILNDQMEVLEEGGEYLGVTTNNQAEYHAVRLALETVKKYQPKKIVFRIDSLLVVNQMNGIFKIRNKELWPIHENIKRLASKYKEVKFKHVPREENKLADAKVNEVLDSR